MHLGHITVTWCLVNSFYPIHQCNISVTEIYCFLKTVSKFEKKKYSKSVEYIHLLCRFLVASWEEQFACQIITKNPLSASATSCFPWVRGQIVQYLIDMLNQNSAWQEMLQLCKTPEFFNKIPSEFNFFIERKKKNCFKS